MTDDIDTFDGITALEDLIAEEQETAAALAGRTTAAATWRRHQARRRIGALESAVALLRKLEADALRMAQLELNAKLEEERKA